MTASLLDVLHYHLIYCYLNSSAQRRLPDFTASTRLSDKFKMADAADAAAVTRFSKCQEEYSIEDVDRLAFLRIMTSSRSLGCCRSKTWQITSRIGACQACLHLMFMFTDVCACHNLEQTPTQHRACFPHQLFQNCSKSCFPFTKYVVFHSMSGDSGVNTANYTCVCLHECLSD